MRPRILTFTALVSLVLALTRAPAAAAPALAPPVDGAFLLGFGAAYGSRVHSGLDIAAASGTAVQAPAAGSVTFAGRLPSDGGEVLGVTITTPEGFKVTCLPLASSSVAKGAVVVAGQPVGTVAEEGDASSGESHVHLSVREGETYFDPAKLLPAPPAPPEPAPSPAPAPVSEPVADAALEPAPSPGAAPVAMPAPAAAAAPAVPAAVPPLAAPAPSPSPAPAAPAGAPAPAVGVAQTAPRPQGAGTLGASAPAALAPPAAAVRTLSRVSRTLAQRHVPAPARPARRVPSSALSALSSGYSRLRALATALAALLVSAALLWPAWRRMAAAGPAAEPVPVRIRT